MEWFIYNIRILWIQHYICECLKIVKTSLKIKLTTISISKFMLHASNFVEKFPIFITTCSTGTLKTYFDSANAVCFYSFWRSLFPETVMDYKILLIIQIKNWYPEFSYNIHHHKFFVNTWNYKIAPKQQESLHLPNINIIKRNLIIINKMNKMCFIIWLVENNGF